MWWFVVLVLVWKGMDKVTEMVSMYLSSKINIKEIESRKSEDPDPQEPSDPRQIGFSYRVEDEEDE